MACRTSYNSAITTMLYFKLNIFNSFKIFITITLANIHAKQTNQRWGLRYLHVSELLVLDWGGGGVMTAKVINFDALSISKLKLLIKIFDARNVRVIKCQRRFVTDLDLIWLMQAYFQKKWTLLETEIWFLAFPHMSEYPCLKLVFINRKFRLFIIVSLSTESLIFSSLLPSRPETFITFRKTQDYFC